MASLRNKHADMEIGYVNIGADIWWQRLADEGDQITSRYGNSEFVIRMVSAVVWEIDRKYREK